MRVITFSLEFSNPSCSGIKHDQFSISNGVLVRRLRISPCIPAYAPPACMQDFVRRWTDVGGCCSLPRQPVYASPRKFPLSLLSMDFHRVTFTGPYFRENFSFAFVSPSSSFLLTFSFSLNLSLPPSVSSFFSALFRRHPPLVSSPESFVSHRIPNILPFVYLRGNFFRMTERKYVFELCRHFSKFNGFTEKRRKRNSLERYNIDNI